MADHPAPPVITLSTHTSSWLAPITFARIAERIDVTGLDLEFAGRARHADPEAIATVARTHRDIHSIWLSTPRRFRSGDWAECTARGVIAVALRANVKHVMIDRPSGLRPEHRLVYYGLVQTLRESLPEHIALNIVVRPDELRGGREHLADVAAMRRTAEEFGYGLALDLCGQIDPHWEAEAAVARLLPRLVSIRIGSLTFSTATSRSRMDSRERQTSRVMAWIANASFKGGISLSPQPPIGMGLFPSVVERTCRQTLASLDKHHVRVGAQPTRQTRSPRSPGVR